MMMEKDIRAYDLLLFIFNKNCQLHHKLSLVCKWITRWEFDYWNISDHKVMCILATINLWFALSGEATAPVFVNEDMKHI